MDDKMPPFTGKLYQFIGLAERVSLGGAILSMFLKRFGTESDTLLILSLTTLSTVYFLSAFKPGGSVEPPPADQKSGDTLDLLVKIIAPKVGWIGCSVAVVGILFYLQGMKGYEQMLMIGGGTLAIVSAPLGIAFLKGNKLQLLMRTMPLATLFSLFINEGWWLRHDILTVTLSFLHVGA